MDFVRLTNLPLPPSINEAYLNKAFGRSGPGRIKSPKYVSFLRDMFCWRLKQSEAISNATMLVGAEGWLEVNVDFVLPYSKVITKDGRPKRHDVDNRLKLLNDAVAEMLLFDDCRIARQKIQKVAVRGLEIGYVDVVIRHTEISLA